LSVKEDLELTLAYVEVFSRELIADVPANRAKLSSVLDDCVEVDKSK